MRYQFTGTQREEFPTIVTDDGALVCDPGAVVELDGTVDHPRLVAVTEGNQVADPPGGPTIARVAETGSDPTITAPDPPGPSSGEPPPDPAATVASPTTDPTTEV